MRLRVLGSWTLVDLYHSTKVYLSISALNSNTSSGSRLNFDFESRFLSCSVDRFREAAVRVYLYLNEILDLEDQMDWKTLFFNMSGGEKDCEIAGGCQVDRECVVMKSHRMDMNFANSPGQLKES